jgi:geranylgeranyl diphosphate synthase type I
VTEDRTDSSIFNRYLSLIDQELARTLDGREELLLYEMIRYHLGWEKKPAQDRAEQRASAGKRVRPTLCFLSCKAVGGDVQLAAPAALAIELVHAFTLLHDDVADRDDVRRGRPTVWRRWGVGQAVTTGDAIYAIANLALGRLDRERLPAAVVGEIHRELNEAVLAVCEGQQLDLSFEGSSGVSVESYLDMIGRKTAALLAAAAAIGGEIGGGSAKTVKALRAFGRHLGVAFQIRDDILGVWGEARALGKPIGSDLRQNKRSLPIIHALAMPDGEGKLAERLAAGIETDEEAAELAAEMERDGGRAFCEDAAQRSLMQALNELAAAALEKDGEAELRELARYLSERTH